MSEVVRDGLRLLEERMQQNSAKLAALRDAAQIGFGDIEQEGFVTLETSQDIENMVHQSGKRAEARIKLTT